MIIPYFLVQQNEDLGLNDINTDHYGAVDYPDEEGSVGQGEDELRVEGPANLAPASQQQQPAVVLSDR